MVPLRPFAVLAFAIGLAAAPAEAAIAGIDIQSREPFAGGHAFGDTGAYEVIRGRLHYAVDPDHPANAAIVDLHLAPRDGDGRVAFSGDFVLLVPVDGGNRRLLYEVGNRGNLGLLAFFNDAPHSNAPATRGDAGSGFLLEEGYTLLWTAWNWDVAPGGGRLVIDLPAAEVDGAPITGAVSAEIVTDRRVRTQPLAWGNSRGYPAVEAAAVLTVRPEQDAPRRKVPAEAWRFAREVGGAPEPDAFHLWLDDGFEPGMIYELVYTASGPKIVGLGLAAIRDSLTFFRHDPASPVAGDVEAAIIFGISQSGRVIQHMLYDGLHIDEAGQPAFDAALIHVAGAGKGSFNHRFAQTTRHGSQHEDHQYPADFFPFTTLPQRDPVTGEEGEVLARARALGPLPHLVYTTTSTEYWTRSTSLLHTDVEGASDIGFDPMARLYFIAGAQHGSWIQLDRGGFLHCGNPLDHRPLVRALLARLDAWATRGEAPPDSVYPRIAHGTLVSVADYRAAFPDIPEVAPPAANLAPPRLDFGPRFAEAGIIDRQPPIFGARFTTLVPMPDADGNDLGGIRLPEIAVPLGTYTGWNLRDPETGAAGAIGRWAGSFFPFADAAGRHDDREAYMAAGLHAAEDLVAQGFLLERDLDAQAAKLGRIYDALAARDPDDPTCAHLAAWQ